MSKSWEDSWTTVIVKGCYSILYLVFPKRDAQVNVVNCANCIVHIYMFVCSKHLALGSDVGLFRLFETTFS